jgi:hypothetical protein
MIDHPWRGGPASGAHERLPLSILVAPTSRPAHGATPPAVAAPTPVRVTPFSRVSLLHRAPFADTLIPAGCGEGNREDAGGRTGYGRI